MIMEEKNAKQARKAYKKHKEETGGQKMVSLRIDLKLLPWLKSKSNMGRYINNLIARDMKSAWLGDDEHTNELDTLHDYDS